MPSFKQHFIHIRAAINDSFRLLKCLSLKKLANYFSLKASYQTSVLTKEFRRRGLPFALSFEPTTACNLRCPQCPSGLRQFSRPTGHLELERFEKWITPMKSHLIWLNLYFQGEPYLNPYFFEFVAIAKSLGIYTFTSTNAHFFSIENAEKTIITGLDRVIVSIDGVTQESYERYRVGGNLEKAKEGILNLVEAKKRLRKSNPYIILQFIVFRHNEHEIPAAKQLAKELGVDKIQFKTAQVYTEETAHEWLPVDSRKSRYINGEGISVSVPNKCWRMWSSSVVTQEGTVVPCCFDKDAEHHLGHLDKSTISEIWKNELSNQLGQSILEDRTQNEICKNCSEGVKVWL